MTAQTAAAMEVAKKAVPVKQASSDLFDSVFDSITRRAFELFEGNGRWPGNELADWFRAESEVLHPVHLELRESEDSFSVEAEVPGFDPKDLEITVEPRTLRIAGERERHEEKKKGKALRSEWCANRILRTIDLPAEIDTGKASASLKAGILTIELPKAPHAKSVPIEPKAT